MRISLDATTLSLARDGLIAVRDAQGTRVRCLSGHLWITEDHARADTILGPDESYVIRHRGLALIMAVAPATLHVLEPHVALAQRVRAWVARWLAPRSARASAEA
jgi:hypothetical protein